MISFVYSVDVTEGIKGMAGLFNAPWVQGKLPRGFSVDVTEGFKVLVLLLPQRSLGGGEGVPEAQLLVLRAVEVEERVRFLLLHFFCY